MKKKMPFLSIVTPTYNRGKLLGRCYTSLCKQTYTDFEWIIVDDGSTDKTEQIINGVLQKESPFNIYYIKKKNGGKHTALNASHPYIHGQYVLILDSDDSLAPDAVKEVLQGWELYESDQSVAMIAFLRRTPGGQIFAYAKDEYVPTDVLRYRRTIVASSDCCEVIRTELFKKYPFPSFGGEKFLAETALWYRAGLDGSCIYINKAIYICEYLENGLSQLGRKMRIKNPKGGMYTSYLRMNKRCFWKERIRAALLYVCYGHFADQKMVDIINAAHPYQGIVLLCYLPGSLMYVIWKRKYK